LIAWLRASCVSCVKHTPTSTMAVGGTKFQLYKDFFYSTRTIPLQTKDCPMAVPLHATRGEQQTLATAPQISPFPAAPLPEVNSVTTHRGPPMRVAVGPLLLPLPCASYRVERELDYGWG
jgi:hypothetical protein